MARWESALDAQLDFFRNHAVNPAMRDYVKGWLSAEGEKDRLPFDAYQRERMPDTLAAMAFNADPIYVDHDMQTLWEGALEGFEPEPLRPEDLVTPAGFLWLPRPFMSKDIHGKMISTRAILWHPQEIVYQSGPKIDDIEKALGYELPGPITIDQKDEDGNRVRIPVQKNGDRFSTQGLLFSALHLSSDKDEYSDIKEPYGLYVHFMLPWAFGSDWPGTTGRPMNERVQAWQALWRLMQQTLAERSTAQPDRHTRKRLARSSFPEKRITVITLRRHAPDRDPDHETIEVNWSHRWIVESYWRRQTYGSGDNKFTRQILVAGHIKGPDHLPLVARKARVFQVVQ